MISKNLATCSRVLKLDEEGLMEQRRDLLNVVITIVCVIALPVHP